MAVPVTIVTPSYNQADFLGTTIQSVLDQDYPALEYFVVDGGSTDGSVNVIRKYEDRLAWWIAEKDRGQAEAINKGLSRAHGEVVAWLNSDDFYLPGAIADAVAVFEENPGLGLVFGDALTIDGEGRPINVLTFGDWSYLDLLSFRIICQPAVFMRRSVLERSGLMDEGYHYMLDHHLWLRIARYSEVKYVPQLWAAARHHAGAKNISQASGFARETRRVVDWLQSHPAFGQDVSAHARLVYGGAYRLQGRYYLDGGEMGKALRYYSQAFVLRPRFTLRHAHRILYAALALMKAHTFLQGLNRHRMDAQQARARQAARSKLTERGFNKWPGLNLPDDFAGEHKAG